MDDQRARSLLAAECDKIQVDAGYFSSRMRAGHFSLTEQAALRAIAQAEADAEARVVDQLRQWHHYSRLARLQMMTLAEAADAIERGDHRQEEAKP